MSSAHDADSAKGCSSWGCLQRRQKQQTQRIVAHPVIGEEQRKYCGNQTTTTKYNLLTFMPKSLFEQYRWVMNFPWMVSDKACH